jgi:hypothetical protein
MSFFRVGNYGFRKNNSKSKENFWEARGAVDPSRPPLPPPLHAVDDMAKILDHERQQKK